MTVLTWLRLAGLAGLLVALIVATPVRTEAPAGKKYALLVGVRQYAHARLTELRYTENDVEELAKLLRSADVNFSSVRLLTTTRGVRDPKQDPTAKNIRAALKDLLRGKTRHDTVLVALSGHGVQLEVKDPNGKDRDRFFPFFCPTDADLKDNVNYKTG